MRGREATLIEETFPMRSANFPRGVLAEARLLAAQGRFQEALEKHVWFHEHALEFDEALAGVRLSFGLTGWVELGDVYPPARQALLSVRDRATRAIAQGDGSFALFHEVAAINRHLGDEAETVRFFELLHQRHPELARQCYPVAEQTLVQAGEYATCSSYVPDPAARVEEICRFRQMTLEIAEENPRLGAPEARLREYAALKFLDETQRLIAILEGAGRTQDAEHVRAAVRAAGGGGC
jgi:hypothetical protein